MNIYYCLLCFILISSCTIPVQDKQAFEEVHFSDEVQLSEDLLRPDMFCVIDSVMVVYDNNKGSNKLFYAFNVTTGQLYSKFGIMGSGPEDYNFPVQMEYNESTNEICILDRNHSKVYGYRLQDIVEGRDIKTSSIIKIPIDASRAVFQNDSSGYCLGAFSTGMIGKYKNETITGYYLDFPDIKDHFLNSNQKFGLFQGDITMNRDGTRLVYSSARCDLIKVISIENNEAKEIMTHYSYTPKFRKMEGDYFSILPENPNGYISVTESNDFIFALFSGRSEREYGGGHYFGNTLHVFDWNGKIVKKITLDKDAWQLHMDRKSEKLYTIHFTTDEQQDMKARYYVYNIKIP